MGAGLAEDRRKWRQGWLRIDVERGRAAVHKGHIIGKARTDVSGVLQAADQRGWHVGAGQLHIEGQGLGKFMAPRAHNTCIPCGFCLALAPKQGTDVR